MPFIAIHGLTNSAFLLSMGVKVPAFQWATINEDGGCESLPFLRPGLARAIAEFDDTIYVDTVGKRAT